jgi:hypothetical protein
VKGRFTAVVHGEFETSRSSRPALVAVVLAVAALVPWLATILVDLAITAGAAVAAVIAACWLLRRRNDRDAELLAERAALLQAEVTTTRPQEIHYHLHLPPGTAASGVNWAALPPGDTATRED